VSDKLPEPYYQDESCTIYCGDAWKMIPLLETRVDLVLTDPPYGLGGKLSGGTWGAKSRGGLVWDQVAPELSELLKLAPHKIIWGGNYFTLPPSRCWLVWRKPDAVATMADCDLAWTNFDKPTRFLSYSIAATNGERNGHPTQKPLQLMRWCISQAPADCATILDPFMGSGTTLRAAKDLGRRCIGIEISPEYCAIAAERLRQEVFAL
jgi:site-specific DNA-methyltransferase (adenine-specific)